MTEMLMVMIGGALGAVGRFAFSNLIKEKTKSVFPVATFLINLSGSFLLGVLLGFQTEHWIRLLLGTGFLGGFTTFSTFQMESLILLREKRRITLLLYLVLTFGLCIAFAFLGIRLGTIINLSF